MSSVSIKKAKITSIAALKQYVAMLSKNCVRHQANILVHANGKDQCPGVRYVNISEDNAELIIEDFHTIYGDRSNIFTVQDSMFSMNCKTLHIKTRDTFAHDITVSITAL